MNGEHSNAPASVTTERISHTPAPWVSFYKHKYNEWHVGVPVSRGSLKLALFPDGCPTDNPAADCLLISAAPDLLSALKDLASCCGHDDDKALLAALRTASSAIAKAEGRL